MPHRVGRYVIVDELGRGGDGVVYRAYDPSLDRRIAVKLLDLRSDSGTLRSELFQEAQALARLSHPNVVQVYDVGLFEGRIYLAMELIVGETLRRWCGGEARPWADVRALFLGCGRGLAAAHQAGLVHRDFKPGNVLVSEDGTPRVADFGLALEVQFADDASETGRRTTRPDGENLAGTPSYMAPEQWYGEALDARADQFAYCVALYESLSGVRPFSGDTIRALAQRTSEGDFEPLPSRVPLHVRNAITRGLAVHPEQRFPDMDALLDALEKDPSSRRRLIVVATGSAVLLTGGVAAAYAVQSPVCESAQGDLGEVWAQRKGAVQTAVTEVKVPYAKTSWLLAEDAIDAYVEQWSDIRMQACTTTRVDKTQSELMLGRQFACLEQRAVALEALLDVVETADEDTVRRLAAMSTSLPSLQACVDKAALATPAQEPHKDVLDAYARQLARVDALLAAGRSRALEDYVEELRLQNPELPDPVDAHLERALGAAAGIRGDRKLSVERLHAALAQSIRLGLGRLAVQCEIDLAFALTQDTGGLSEAQRRVETSIARWEHIGSPVGLRLPLLNIEAVLGLDQADYAGAERTLREAIAVAEASKPAPRAHLSGLYGNLATTLYDQSRLEDAEEAVSTSIDIARASKGPRHPDTIGLLQNAGAIAYGRGALDLAMERIREAHALNLEIHGPNHPKLLDSFNGLGNVANGMGDKQLAEQHYRSALAVAEASVGRDHLQATSPKLNLAAILIEDGRAAEAEPLLRSAVETFELERGAEHPEIYELLLYWGISLVHVDRFEDARDAFARAERVLEVDGRDVTPALRFWKIRLLPNPSEHMSEVDELATSLDPKEDEDLIQAIDAFRRGL